MQDPDFRTSVESARHGDATAINSLFVRYYPRVRDLVHHNLEIDLRRNRPWLDALFSTGDVVQDVFVNVLRDVDDFAGQTEREFVNYLISVTKNRLVDAIRFHEALRRDRRRVCGTPGDQVAASSRQDPARHAVSADEVGRYCRVLDRFPERERILLRSRLEDTRPFSDLATELAYPSADAARKAYYAAKARLVAQLVGQGGASTR